MPRRVHDLAKEWGIEPKELTTRLEKMGLRNKRFSLIADDGVVKAINVESKPGVNESGAAHILGQL